MKSTILLSAALLAFQCTFAQTARVQVIHNSADRAADSVDVYLGSTLLLNNFAFRTATPFIDAPAGTPIRIGIAPKTSTSVADTIYTVTTTLTPGSKYILVANGLVSPTGYTPSASMAPFRISVYAGAHETADTMGRTDVLVAHGCTDAPQVDVRAGSAVLVNDIAFGQFSSGYLSLPNANYTLDVTNTTGSTIVQRYSAPLATLGLADSAITVLASGFLDSTVNSNGRKFGLWVALRMGGNLIPLPTAPIPSSVAEFTSNASSPLFPNPARNTAWISGTASVESVSIVDLNGRIVKTLRQPANNALDIADVLPGVYSVFVTEDNGNRFVVRLVKE